MMELLRAWLTGVTAAAILCALADSLMPPGPVRKAGKLAGGLVMLAAILRPLVQIQASDPARWLEAARPEETAQVQALEEERDEAVKALIEESFAAYIVDKAAALGAECTAAVACEPEGNGVFFPRSAVICGQLSPEQREALLGALEEELDLPRTEVTIEHLETKGGSP